MNMIMDHQAIMQRIDARRLNIIEELSLLDTVKRHLEGGVPGVGAAAAGAAASEGGGPSKSLLHMQQQYANMYVTQHHQQYQRWVDSVANTCATLRQVPQMLPSQISRMGLGMGPPISAVPTALPQLPPEPLPPPIAQPQVTTSPVPEEVGEDVVEPELLPPPVPVPVPATAQRPRSPSPPRPVVDHEYLALRANTKSLVDRAILTQSLYPGFIPKAPDEPQELMIAKRRRVISVCQWGAPPFAMESSVEGAAFIPNGFRAKTRSDNIVWIAETKVEVGPAAIAAAAAATAANKVLPGILFYRFTREDKPENPGPWETTASAAYHQACSLLLEKHEIKNPTRMSRTNGKLIIGAMYKSVQAFICQLFHDQISTLKAHITKTAGPDAFDMYVIKTAATASAQKRISSNSAGGSIKRIRADAADNNDDEGGEGAEVK